MATTRPSGSPHRQAGVAGGARRLAFLTGVLSCVLTSALAGRVAVAVELGVADPQLHQQRATHRAAMREALSVKSEQDDPALWGLLVIPVDFADARLPDDWDAATQLGPDLYPLDGETVASFFRIASNGRVDVRITLAPLVRLPGERWEYSDRYWGGSSKMRSRMLATAALEAARGYGIDFRALDMEGPDRLPGTVDDDGEVDGVLILHAGVGAENDQQTGLVEALQFYLDVPVVSRGVQGRSYAVASMYSGLGVWVHETGHLIGLEDRYDRTLPGQPDEGDMNLSASGGLGRFSLMAAGAWGVGGGHQAALVDAYSCAQLGWCDVVTWPGSPTELDTLLTTSQAGEVWRVWTRGEPGPEYFLFEARGGPGTEPFDAVLPEPQLLIYHVDENLPEGVAGSGGFDNRHLRVMLVEADGDGHLAVGEDLGRPEDLFPGPDSVTSFGTRTWPSSDGYVTSSEVEVHSIAAIPGGVVLAGTTASGYGFDLEVSFTAAADTTLNLAVRETGLPLSEASCEVRVDPLQAHGGFAGGATSITAAMTRGADGVWRNTEPIPWRSAAELASGATTRLLVRIRATTAAGSWYDPLRERFWLWSDPPSTLDFASNWPGEWTIHLPGQTNTTWHRWLEPQLTADGSPLLVCTGAEFTTEEFWPAVNYENSADASLTSGLISGGVTAIRMVHAMDSEGLPDGRAADGGRVEWVLPDGVVVPAEVVGGYPETILPRAENALHGEAVFAGPDSLLNEGQPTWRVDLIAVPASGGPFRLRLRYASDRLWRRCGWFVRQLETLTGELPAGAFPVSWLDADEAPGPALVWSWPWQDALRFRVEARVAPDRLWTEVWEGLPTSGAANHSFILPATGHGLGDLELADGTRAELRVVAVTEQLDIVSRPVVTYQGGGAARIPLLSAAYPNPAHGEVRFFLAAPVVDRSRIDIYDVRGRLVRHLELGGGNQVVTWDGRDAGGAAVATGIYTFRLETSSGTHTRKVTWLR